MDYQALRTIESIIRNQNFERAAQELAVTQSAVSQRVNQLEAEFGQRLLIRELPYRATAFGETLLAHLRKVEGLEQELLKPEAKTTIRVALNVDSIELWFNKVFHDQKLAKRVNLELTIADEKYTLGFLKSGRVDVSIGTNHLAIANHECTKIGAMTYVLVASPEFKKQYARRGMRDLDFSNTPAIIFNDQDDLHTEYLKAHHGYLGSYPRNSIPSLSATKAALISGFGYGIQPMMDVEKELKSKRLVLLDRENSFKRVLYLHHWSYQTPALKEFLTVLLLAAQDLK